jgi:hypothetical protein
MAERNITHLQGTAPDVLSMLDVAIASDQQGDRVRNRWGTAGCSTGCVGVLGIGFSVMMLGEIGRTGFGIMAVGAVLVVFAIYAGVQHSKLEAKDLDNDRLALARELVQRLSPDLSDKKPVELTLRHGDSFQWGALPHPPPIKGTPDPGREDTWLELKGRLTDGSIFQLTVTENVKRKTKAKRKYTKIKDRSTCDLSLVLRVPEGLYPSVEQLESLSGTPLAKQPGLRLAGIRVENSVIRARFETAPMVRATGRAGAVSVTNERHKLDVDKLIAIFALLYAGLSNAQSKES